MKVAASAVLEQLDAAGVLSQSLSLEEREASVVGRLPLMVIGQLRADERFAEGPLYKLHADVGEDLTEFRSYRGTLGRGSLQIVIDKETGRFYADVDAFNPYADLVNFVGHSSEVVAGVWRKLRRRRA